MRIQHNIMAMSAYRNYTNNVSAMKKNLEKLSSGYKINRAGDDAAGLAISEKMRAQITGLETAQKNAKDGISLVQTAEGALTEVHDMLNRMVTLATQSANGTYDNETDRAQMQKELDQLRSEIDRIADSSNFNGIKLLDGSMSGSGVLGDATNVTVTAIDDGVKAVGETQKGKYVLDLKDITIQGVATAGGGYSDVVFALTLGNKEVVSCTITAATFVAASGVVTAGDIMAVITADASITVNTVIFSMATNGTQLVFTGDAKPANTADVTNFTDKTLLAKATATPTGDGSHNQSYDVFVHHEEERQYVSPDLMARGKFALTGVKDGTQITIGDETYTFKVGKNGTGSGGTVIDLSMYEESNANLDKIAAKALSRQSNEKFCITADNDGTVGLLEKKGQVDYEKDWDLHGTDGTANDAPWKNVDTSESVVRIAHRAAATGKSLQLQIGDTADSFNQLKIDIRDMHCSSLGIDSSKMSIADQDSAAKAVDMIKAAINQVSDVRGTLGATQNRLDHTINNLGVMTENIQDAESTIRDTDIASEMMAYTKNNILIQSAQAMLAQANQVPQGVLQLLQ